LVAREVARLRGCGFDLDVTREAGGEIFFSCAKVSIPALAPGRLRRAVESQLQDAVVRDFVCDRRRSRAPVSVGFFYAPAVIHA